VITVSQDPNRREWARECVLNYYPDTEALPAFTEIVRQQEGLALKLLLYANKLISAKLHSRPEAVI
jgi:hypothetical protein